MFLLSSLRSNSLLRVRTKVAYFADDTPVHEPCDGTDVSTSIIKNSGEFSSSNTEIDIRTAGSTAVKMHYKLCVITLTTILGTEYHN